MKISNKILSVLSILIYLISLTQNAFKVEDLEKIKIYKSYEVLLMGGIGFLGGGIFETFIWTSNIWFLLALIFTKNKKYREALIFSSLATLISTSFMLWKEVLASENGRNAKIVSLELGYFLWITSIIILFSNSIFSFFKNNHQ